MVIRERNHLLMIHYSWFNLLRRSDPMWTQLQYITTHKSLNNTCTKPCIVWSPTHACYHCTWTTIIQAVIGWNGYFPQFIIIWLFPQFTITSFAHPLQSLPAHKYLTPTSQQVHCICTCDPTSFHHHPLSLRFNMYSCTFHHPAQKLFFRE